MIFWGMGISQHIHGTDNSRCLIALSMITGQIGRPGTGLHPLRGQNNVQGASDAGLIPMMFPDYKRVDNPEAHAWFSDYWGAELDDKPGLTVVEIMHANSRKTTRVLLDYQHAYSQETSSGSNPHRKPPAHYFARAVDANRYRVDRFDR